MNVSAFPFIGEKKNLTKEKFFFAIVETQRLGLTQTMLKPTTPAVKED